MKQDWEYKKLGDVCDILDSKRKPVTKSNRKSGIYPYYGATGIQDYVDSYIFDGRFLLVGEDGAKWGKGDNSAFIIEGKSWVNNHAHILRIHENMSDVFIRYFLNGADLNSYITGAVVPKLTQAALVSIQIPVPPLSEQSKIVAELDLLTGIIDKQNAQLKELDNLAQAIFYDMFGDPIENPKGWEVKKLGDLSTSVSYGTSSPSSTVGKYKYLRMNNITYEGFLDLTDLKYIDMDDTEFEKYSVREGDVLFNRTNSMDLIGKTTYIHDMEPMIIAGYIIRVRLADSVLSVYVSKFMNTPAMKKKLRGMAKGAVNQANINSKELKSIDIPVPPLTLQQSFAEKIQSIEKQKEAIRASIADSQKLLDYTMDKYFG